MHRHDIPAGRGRQGSRTQSTASPPMIGHVGTLADGRGCTVYLGAERFLATVGDRPVPNPFSVDGGGPPPRWHHRASRGATWRRTAPLPYIYGTIDEPFVRQSEP